MAKKNASEKIPEPVQEPVEQPEASQVTPETQSAENAAPEDEKDLVRYRVKSPGGVYLRVGPGQAYREICVMAQGAELWGEDRSGLLRDEPGPLASAWIAAEYVGELGFVDSAFLERVC